MIERMKKLTLMIYHGAKDQFLTDLQNLGVVHLETDSQAQNETIADLRSKIITLNKTLHYLTGLKPPTKDKIKELHYSDDMIQLTEEIEDQKDKLAHLQAQLEGLEKEAEALVPWGIFHPENIESLKENGIHVKFFSTGKPVLEAMEKDFAYEVISELKGHVYFVVLYQGQWDKEIDATEEKFVLKNRLSLEKEMDSVRDEIHQQKATLYHYIGYQKQLEKTISELEIQLAYQVADNSLASAVEGAVLMIRAWIPLKQTKKVEKFLADHDVAYVMEDPDVIPEYFFTNDFEEMLGKLSDKQQKQLARFYQKDGDKYRYKGKISAVDKDLLWGLLEEAGNIKDNVPIKLKNGPFAKLFEPITRMHSMPQYNEVDPTPFFAPFFAAFFGLCLADVGYGLILLIAVIAALVMVKNDKLRPIMILGMVLGITTILGGFILDTFFGAKISQMDFIPNSVKSGIIYQDMYAAMGLAVIIGIVQVIVGFLLQSVNRMRKYGIAGIFYPLGTIIMIVGGVILVLNLLVDLMGTSLTDYNAGPIKLGDMIAMIPNGMTVGAIIMGIGVLFVLLFNALELKIFLRPLTGLWELYGIITGVPGDILSYIRLFALGLAGGLLGSAFNQIAFMVRGDNPNVVSLLFMVIIFILGHGINLALAALSAFVHPLRLILLEFYKSVDFTGGGVEYSPFKK
ncbi:MAG: hypothetical protein MJB14_13865 [Spirochaetes bacterium]|nr:hypothetical protein [Spirochaetota bacterium]